jgi:two-component system, cell cycle sensor histidine kinase and response regulator CckA
VQTILVVDDEEVVRSVVRDMLESEGYTILDTGDPQHALRLAREQPVHLLLSDVVMPLMKGPELAAKLLAVSPSTKILLMSAYPMSEAAASGLAFLGKPFSVQSLNEKVRQVLQQSSPFARPARIP